MYNAVPAGALCSLCTLAAAGVPSLSKIGTYEKTNYRHIEKQFAVDRISALWCKGLAQDR